MPEDKTGDDIFMETMERNMRMNERKKKTAATMNRLLPKKMKHRTQKITGEAKNRIDAVTENLQGNIEELERGPIDDFRKLGGKLDKINQRRTNATKIEEDVTEIANEAGADLEDVKRVYEAMENVELPREENFLDEEVIEKDYELKNKKDSKADGALQSRKELEVETQREAKGEKEEIDWIKDNAVSLFNENVQENFSEEEIEAIKERIDNLNDRIRDEVIERSKYFPEGAVAAYREILDEEEDFLNEIRDEYLGPVLGRYEEIVESLEGTLEKADELDENRQERKQRVIDAFRDVYTDETYNRVELETAALEDIFSDDYEDGISEKEKKKIKKYLEKDLDFDNLEDEIKKPLLKRTKELFSRNKSAEGEYVGGSGSTITEEYRLSNKKLEHSELEDYAETWIEDVDEDYLDRLSVLEYDGDEFVEKDENEEIYCSVCGNGKASGEGGFEGLNGLSNHWGFFKNRAPKHGDIEGREEKVEILKTTDYLSLWGKALQNKVEDDYEGTEGGVYADDALEEVKETYVTEGLDGRDAVKTCLTRTYAGIKDMKIKNEWEMGD